MRAASVLVAGAGSVALVTFLFASPGAAMAARGAHDQAVKVGGETISVAKSSRFDDSQSDNWSGYNLGYLSTDTMYKSISGTWTVPTAKPETKGQAEYGSTWIGIGGGCLNTSCTETDNTLIQAGTEEDVSKTGVASYSSWYELIPETSTPEKIAIHPGDVINCSITETSSGEWTIVLKDTTDGQSFTESTAYSSSELTAEWIVETPTLVGTSGEGVATLPNLGDVHFKNAEVNGAGAALTAADAVQLVNSSGSPVATPSDPNAKGTAFIDCTYASSCKA
jgi:hypothetical protein